MYNKLFVLGMTSGLLSGCIGGDYAWSSDPEVSVYENHKGVAYQAEMCRTKGEVLAFRLEGTDAALFSVNASTGEVEFLESPDFEMPLDYDEDNRYQFTVVSLDANTNQRLSSLSVSIFVKDAEQLKASQLFPLPNSYVEPNKSGVVPLVVSLKGENNPVLFPDDWESDEASITRFFQYYLFAIEPSYNQAKLSEFLDPNQFSEPASEGTQNYIVRSFVYNLTESNLLNYGYTISPTEKITVTYNNKVQEAEPFELEWQLNVDLTEYGAYSESQLGHIASNKSNIYIASDNELSRISREGGEFEKVLSLENATIHKLSAIDGRIFVVMHDYLLNSWSLKELSDEFEFLEHFKLTGFDLSLLGEDFDVEILHNDSEYEVVFLPKELCSTETDLITEPALYRFKAEGFILDKSLLTASTSPLFDCKEGRLVDRNLTFDLEYSSPKLSYNYFENAFFYWGRSFTDDNVNGITMTSSPTSVTVGTQYWFDEAADDISDFQHFSRHFDKRKSFYIKDQKLYVVDGYINGVATQISGEYYQVHAYTVDAYADLIYSVGLWGNVQTPVMAVHHIYSGATSYTPLSLQ